MVGHNGGLGGSETVEFKRIEGCGSQGGDSVSSAAGDFSGRTRQRIDPRSAILAMGGKQEWLRW